ncbi:hypothetical protein LS482_06445 [Sinomicrobium kalidii]|uniref:hypothetical protein n=1 Tax=Sinomicrobium kalidii TaxID=2900738 RepID=UPI001E546B9A|nr:hypothetical protein [Sinomicrobium kalidii]UGU17509.1 hypothetical protein LS482_06445 [Sinomicrobium kalidii]
MSKIVLEVDDTVARKWKASSKKWRKQVAALIGRVITRGEDSADADKMPKGYALPTDKELQKHFNKVQEDTPSYTQFLDELGDIAAKNGLDQELLDQLLAEDD